MCVIHAKQCLLTHWGRVMHKCVKKLTIIGSDNGLSPGWHQAIICTNVEIWLIRPSETNFTEILTHWGRVTHICVSKLTIIGSDNGLSPDRRQAIIWTNAGILLIGPLGTNFNETSIEIHTVSFKKIHLKLSPGKWRPFCLSLNVLIFTHFHSRKCIWKCCLEKCQPLCLCLNSSESTRFTQHLLTIMLIHRASLMVNLESLEEPLLSGSIVTL